MTNVERVVVIYQISNAIQKVHTMGIIHRDLKLENIFLDNQNKVKASDFGFSKIIHSQSQFQSQMIVVGTMIILAPEILLQKEKYNSKVDVYLILMNGKLPHVNKNTRKYHHIFTWIDLKMFEF